MTLTLNWSDCGSSDGMGIYSGANSAGPLIKSGTLIGKNLNSLFQKMYRIGSSGTLTCTHKNSSHVTKGTSNTVNVSTLTSDTAYANASTVEFVFPSAEVISADDYFIISTNSTDGGAKLWISIGTCDSGATQIMENTSPQTNATPRGSADYTIPPVTTGTRLPPPPLVYNI